MARYAPPTTNLLSTSHNEDAHSIWRVQAYVYSHPPGVCARMAEVTITWGRRMGQKLVLDKRPIRSRIVTDKES